MNRGESTSRFSPNPSERSWSNAGIDESSPTPTTSLLMTPTFSSGPHIVVSPTTPVLQNSAFVVSESRHGRTRKLTSRVQEMFKETLQRQRNHGNSIIALQERMSAANLAAAAQHAHAPTSSSPQSPLPEIEGAAEDDDEEGPSYRIKRSHPMMAPGSEDEEDEMHWCFCNEKSYGDMVQCDNRHVSVGFFNEGKN